MKILAIDYGLKRIGFAYSEGLLAQPMGKLTVKNPTDALEKSLKTARTYEAELLIVGLPEPDSIGAQEFGENLARLSGIKVKFVNETLTSVEAHERLKIHPLKKRRGLVDAAAASLILSHYLENHLKHHG